MLDAIEKLKTVGLLVMVVMLLGAGWRITHLNMVVAEQEVTIFRLETDLDEAVGVNKQFEKAADDQNRAVAYMVEAAKKRKSDADAAIAKASTKEATWRAKYEALLHSPPPASADQCKAVEALFNRYIDLRKESAK